MTTSIPTKDTVDMNFHEYLASIDLPLKDIESATNNFGRENIIAQGGFSILYKGQLLQSLEPVDIVVHKFLKLNVNAVTNDLNMCKDLKHKNVMTIFKLVDTEDQAFTVHKYEANGSLDKHLSGSNLTWMQRLKICLDVAHALQYLHFGLKHDYSVIHGNVKSSKILLDRNWEAKLHDFRCAVKVKRHSLYLTSKYNGTLEYMDPSFESTGGLTHKSDVFSFGVVMFEVLFGRKASTEDNDKWYFAEQAKLRYVENGLMDDMIDPGLRKQMNRQSLDVFSEIAYCCLKEHRADRPDMNHIVNKLETAMELQRKHQSLLQVQSPELEGAYSSPPLFKGGNMDYLKVALSEIISATNDFSKSHYIASGGFGEVYRAKLDRFDALNPSETKGKNDDKLPNVAIKRIPSPIHGGDGFFAELELLSKCKHQNIVSLLGFCHEGHDMVLIYEYASKGSLDDYLINNDNTLNLTWERRLQICLDIAQGLDYLHESMPDKPTIIHRDMKSANILLDDKLMAKIADFGLSKLHHESQQDKTLVTRVAGTWVYMDPEYIRTGKLKKQSDIYSFGVVLFEIMCGKLAYDENFKEGLAAVARQCYKDGTLKKLVDPNIQKTDENIFTVDGGVNEDSLETFIEIASLCVLEHQSKRPTMKIIIKELKKALSLQKNSKDMLHISLKHIEVATENFSDHKCIREGRHWKQYEGEMTHANKRITIIAKRWDSAFPQSQHEFATELQILKKSKQENIISLVGYCNEMGEEIIVYKNTSNGSLDKHLGDCSLTWMRRLKICIDIARGLEYLHTSVSMIHRDIKSASILLDGNWRAKISNLELSTQLSEMKPIEHVTDDNAYGSLSYIAKRDKKQGYLTQESDIYSLGVVLKQVLWGRLTEPKDRGTHHVVENGQEILYYLVLEGIKEQIDVESLNTFAVIAGLCLAYNRHRPRLKEVITELEKALEFQEDCEIWKPRLPIDYTKIIEMSKTPDVYNSIKLKKDLYRMLSKGVLLRDGKMWFSLGSNGEKNEMVSATTFSYTNHTLHDKWCTISESRFEKVAEMLDISNLMIQIETRTQFLSPDTVYGVYLVFKFCDSTSINSRNPMYVDLKYREGISNCNTLHAYFARWRDDEWMMIELYRFKNQNDDVVFKFLLESLSPRYCWDYDAIYVEGIEFRPLVNGGHELETKKSNDIQQGLKSNSNLNSVPINSHEMILKGYRNNDDSRQKWFSLIEVADGKKHLMLSATATVYNFSDSTLFNSQSSPQSRFEEVLELRPQLIFRIDCTIKSQMLSPDTEYMCYLVFKLSENCSELHGPIEVRDLLEKNKVVEIVYFRSPSPWNIHDFTRLPKQRKDGWMEVNLHKFNSRQLKNNDCVLVNLKLISYQGCMSGLVVCGLEFRPM